MQKNLSLTQQLTFHNPHNITFNIFNHIFFIKSFIIIFNLLHINSFTSNNNSHKQIMNCFKIFNNIFKTQKYSL